MQFLTLLPIVLTSLCTIATAAPALAPAPAPGGMLSKAAPSYDCHWHVFNTATKVSDRSNGKYACCTENGKEPNGKPKLNCRYNNAICEGGFPKTWCCPASGNISGGQGCQKNFVTTPKN